MSDLTPPPHVAEISDQAINERARALWELEGKQTDDPKEYWHRAKELLEAEACSNYPPSASRGHRR